jgi:hypothetical protein
MRKNAIVFLLSIFIVTVHIAPAQSVGVGTTTPHPAAALDVASTDKGVLLPRLTKAQRDAIGSPAIGLTIFQTDGKAGLYRYNGTHWLLLADATVVMANIGSAQTVHFAYTGAVQSFTVPASVYQITITARGAQGGNGVIHQPAIAILYPAGGLGGSATGTFTVTPGQVLYIYVGGKPTTPTDNVTTGATIAGGYNGGGNGIAEFTAGLFYIPGGGGGATDVRLNGTALTDRVIVAGGGGGSTQRTFVGAAYTGGAGGGPSGGNGLCASSGCGAGGTQSTGHALGIGGNGTVPAAAGGGGGYWGGSGGGAADAAGGGGSGYIVSTATAASITTGTVTGNGSLTIDYQAADTIMNFNAVIEGGRVINLHAGNIATGTVAPARLGTGVPGTSNFLRGDGAWATVPVPTLWCRGGGGHHIGQLLYTGQWHFYFFWFFCDTSKHLSIIRLQATIDH